MQLVIFHDEAGRIVRWVETAAPDLVAAIDGLTRLVVAPLPGDPAGYEVIDGALVPRVITPPDPLMLERAAMQPLVRAWRAALKLLPATGYLHLLDRVTQLVEGARAVDPYNDLVVWADGVTQIVRLHPDMDDFGALVGQSPEQIDAICRLAMAIEQGAEAQLIADLVAAYGAA
jgi:hypothetical protein